MSKSIKDSSLRIQFELSKSRATELESIMEEVHVKTRTEFLNNAITLLIWAISEAKAGRIIASVDEEKEKYRELVMPVLEVVKQSANKPVREDTASKKLYQSKAVG